MDGKEREEPGKKCENCPSFRFVFSVDDLANCTYAGIFGGIVGIVCIEIGLFFYLRG